MTKQTDEGQAPISLPPGSFTTDDLEKVQAAADKAKPEDRDATILDQIQKADKGVGTSYEGTPMPDHKFVDVKRNDVKRGLVETVQVYDAPAEAEKPKVSDKPKDDAPAASDGKAD